jgi:hypothetical protein
MKKSTSSSKKVAYLPGMSVRKNSLTGMMGRQSISDNIVITSSTADDDDDEYCGAYNF